MIKYLFLVALAFFLFFFYDASDVYTKILEYERDKAGLSKKELLLPSGNVVYLEKNEEEHETLILLHGLGANKDNWDKFVLKLKNKYHVLIPDMAGHGESTRDKTLDYSLLGQVQQLELFLKEKKVKDFHLVGNSMGGGIAILYSDRHPEKVKTLTLIDAIGVWKTNSDIFYEIEKSGKNPMLDVCSVEKLDTLLEFAMYKPPYIPVFIKEAIVSEKCKHKDIERHMYNVLMPDMNMSSVVKNISVPTLVIWGDKDRILHVNNAELFGKLITNVHVEILKNIGHMPMLETPSKTAMIFESFVTKNN